MLKSYTIAIIALISSLFYSIESYSQGKSSISVTLNLSNEYSKDQVKARELKLDQFAWQKHLSDLKIKKVNKLTDLSTRQNRVLTIQGPGTSGGGNNYESEFFYLSEQLLKEILNLNLDHSLANAIISVYSRLKSEESIYFTNDHLILNDKEKIAINDYTAFVILVNKNMWDNSTFLQKRQIIIHELLGLAKSVDFQIDDSDYKITNQIFLKLQRKDQKNFLLNTDYPRTFELPDLRSKTYKSSLLNYEFNNEKGQCQKDESMIEFKMQRIETADGLKIQIMFDIQCRMVSGRFYGHGEGRDGDSILDVSSLNLLELNVAYGSYIVGWVSGKNILLRTPISLVALNEKADGSYHFKFEFRKGQDRNQIEVIEAIISEVTESH